MMVRVVYELTEVFYIILFTFITSTLNQMSYPFYYPYYSARNVYPNPLAEIDLAAIR